ncbi:hydroxyisourate hydrolase [Hymenobacter wooponensis]|uniref:5-hydroxyisourate hydrolase n=1 Tax=Hymenobacter wooponensis TaxID=1525360 RepID=A0A4Z0MMS1_9BACT|nr:hydroxyisourate hydrolase [Hymenobacter wooponensis]TGD80676.1 hydroxyisourate hydrolase [Hymenobacter wooponensis]
MSQLTTHILDTTQGKPATGVAVTLYRQQAQSWAELAYGTTNSDGRISDLLPKEEILPLGIYKLKFLTQPYFDQQDVVTFYPFVEIVFAISSSEHYHVPLLLNPFGYSTYRGS